MMNDAPNTGDHDFPNSGYLLIPSEYLSLLPCEYLEPIEEENVSHILNGYTPSVDENEKMIQLSLCSSCNDC